MAIVYLLIGLVEVPTEIVLAFVNSVNNIVFDRIECLPEVKSRLDVQSVLEHEVRVYPREVRIEWVDIDVLLWVDP